MSLSISSLSLSFKLPLLQPSLSRDCSRELVPFFLLHFQQGKPKKENKEEGTVERTWCQEGRMFESISQGIYATDRPFFLELRRRTGGMYI